MVPDGGCDLSEHWSQEITLGIPARLAATVRSFLLQHHTEVPKDEQSGIFFTEL